ncbi:amidohydrolase [Fictibacillus sp. WQ 8-8]|uniref:amidohydrolase family protein n=1 Tax=Fictibacillus sp. WQ 8-8 TaxID=2938788 RepID=UPI00210CBAD5|nr:amidohydrolase family protein [Fictibacillus sp. WQ 8-8]MCQ6268105.1 amidohydrolase [Fictibacillus sp. WQ 8-8]
MDKQKEKKLKGIIDCDVHPHPSDYNVIKSYMSEPWRSRFNGNGKRGIYDNPIHVNRLDSVTPHGGYPCSDPSYMREQLLDEYGINYAILLPRAFATKYPSPDFATVVASAFNDWLADVWLDNNNEDGRCKGSITVAHQDPQAAAKEIDRWAGHPHMVQVMMDSGARAPFGQRQYYPIYEACERNGFPIALHPGTEGVGPNEIMTPGYPTTYIEWHTGLMLSFQAHLISFITEGVFERFPGLKLVLVEGGSAWLPPLLWRLDAEWKPLREEVPWVKKRPSEYILEHVRITSQPLENPDNREHLLQMFEMMDAKNILMFSSDYPHWDFDSPTRSFPKLPEDLKRRIFFENARELYNLD